MAIYIYNILSIPIYSFFIKNRKLYCKIVGLQMFLILALKSITVGEDLTNYLGGYEYINTLSFTELLGKLHFFKTADLIYPYSYESGYTFLCWVIAKLGFSFHGFLIVCAAFTMLSVCRFIDKYSLKPWLSYVLFVGLGFYAYAFGILRQTLAVSVCMWIVPYVLGKKWTKAFLLLLAAFWLHRASLLFLILFLVYNKKLGKNAILRYIAFCVVLLAIAPVLYQTIIGRILVMIGKGAYLEVNYSLNNQIILMFVIVLLILIFIRMKTFDENVNNLTLWAFLLSIPVEIIGMCNDGFARAVEFYYIFAILLIPNIIAQYGTSQNKDDVALYHTEYRTTRYILCGVVMAAMLFLMVYSLNGTKLVPYEFFFNEGK